MSKKNKKPRMTRAQEREHKKRMKLPINRFMSLIGKDGKLKYAVAEKLWAYTAHNPDPALSKNRLCNALLHELRFHITRSDMYLVEFTKGSTTLKNKEGNIMSPEECKLSHIMETQAIHITLATLRSALEKFLEVCDGEILTFELFDRYVLDVEKVVKKLGYVLFPTKVEIIAPM